MDNNLIRCSQISVDCVANDPVDIRCGGPEYLGFDFNVRVEQTEEMKKFIAVTLEIFEIPLTNLYISGTIDLSEKDVWTKERIVKAWQKNGKVVAMTGDGVNDAPAIKDAHVGVGMGITGTDVTKSAADIVLMDDSFSTIIIAVEEGRRIYNNIRNNIVFSLSSNFAEIFTIIIGLLTKTTILLPIYILFIDLVTDSIPSICLSFEKSEDSIMNKKPRGINKPLFTPFIKSCIASSAIIETTFVVLTYFISLKMYGQETAMSLALLSMVVQEIVYSISCRNLKESVVKQGLFSNKAMNYGLLLILLIELIVFVTPIGKLISITSIDISLILIVFLINLMAIFIYELIKPFLVKWFKD